MRRLMLVMSATLAAGCTLGPDYRRPVVPLPEAHRGADAASPDRAASLADLQWSELFRDPTLTALVGPCLE